MRFIDKLKLCDRLIVAPPSAEAVEAFVGLTRNDVLADYAFSRLTRPDWLAAIQSQGFFDRRLGPTLGKNGTILFKTSAILTYLERVASTEPERTIEVLDSIPVNSNPAILSQFAQIAMTLPPDFDLRAGAIIVRWLNSPDLIAFSSLELGKLIEHFAVQNESKIALSIAKRVLALLPDPDRRNRPLSWREVRPIIDPWEYQQILSRHIPALANSAPLSTLKMLSGLLRTAVRLSGGKVKGRNETVVEDFSYIWRPEISSGESHGGVRDQLISSVTDVATQAFEASPTKVVAILERNHYAVFYRIVLTLLASCHVESTLIRAHLLNQELENAISTEREYRHLLELFFTVLTPIERNAYLMKVEQGWEVTEDQYRERMQSLYRDDFEVPVDAYEMASDRWRRDRLEPIHEYLDPAWKERYSQLIQKVGVREEISSRPIITWGNPDDHENSELTQELEKLEPGELIAWISAGKVSTHENLPLAVADVIGKSPSSYVRYHAEFRALGPDFVLPLIAVFGRILGMDSRENVNLALSFLENIAVDYGQRNPNGEESFTREQACLRALGSVIFSVFDREQRSLPIENRAAIWRIISTLAENQEPTPEYERKHLSATNDPATMSINSLRGEAIHTAIRYALWVRSIDDSGNHLNFSDLPEVGELLRTHLDLELEPRLSVRAVYGQWLPWLVQMAPEWVRENLRLIFPEDVKYDLQREAAWFTYLAYSPAYDSTFELLRGEYSNAISRMPQRSEWRIFSNTPDENLAQHIAAMYWRGKIDLSPRSDFHQLLEKTDESVRSHLISFIGRSLKGAEEVPNEFIERLIRFFEVRYSRAEASDFVGFKDELSPFSSWVLSRKFPDDWALKHYEVIARRCSPSNLDFAMIGELARLVDTHTSAAILSLGSLIDRGLDPHVIYSTTSEIRRVLEVAIASKPGDIREKAKGIADNLLELGHFNFRDLLD